MLAVTSICEIPSSFPPIGGYLVINFSLSLVQKHLVVRNEIPVSAFKLSPGESPLPVLIALVRSSGRAATSG